MFRRLSQAGRVGLRGRVRCGGVLDGGSRFDCGQQLKRIGTDQVKAVKAWNGQCAAAAAAG